MHKWLKQFGFFSLIFMMFMSVGGGVSFADTGDIAIYREATGIEDEDNQAWHDEPWDTTVSADATEFTKGGSDVLIDLDAGGHYFVWYSLNFDVNSGGGADRTVHLGRLEVGGTTVEAGYSQGYTRAASGELQAYLSGGAIINAAAGDDLKVEAMNASNNVSEQLERRPNLSGVSILKLDDNWDYLRIHETTGGTNYNNAAMTNFTWDTADEVDTGSYSYTPGNANVTLEQSGHYLVTYSIRLTRAANGNRVQMQSQVEINGTPVEHCHSGTYIRGNLAGDIIQEGAISGVCIVDANAGEDLVVQIQMASTGGGTTTTDVADASGLTIVKLPEQADFLRIHENGGGQDVEASSELITWDFDDEDEAAFTHNTVSNTGTIEINDDGDYLFTGCLHADRAASGVRYSYIKQWEVDGVDLKYGAFGAYNRGDQGTFDAFDSSNCGATIFNDLTAGKEVGLNVTHENGTTGGAPTFQANEMGITAVYIDSMFMRVQGSTDLANGTTVGLAVNGSLLAAHSDVADGSYSITVGVDHITAGNTVTVFGSMVTDADEATSVTEYDGSGDITGLTLSKHKLTIGSADNRGVTIQDLGQFDNNDFEDIMHIVLNGSLAIDADDVYVDDVLVIDVGDTLTIGGTQGIIAHDIDINGDLTGIGPNFIRVSGSWDATGGDFTNTNSTVVFTGTTSETIRSAGESFNNLMINDSLVGYWRLDEGSGTKAVDSSGNAHDGMYVSAPTPSTAVSGTMNFANPRSLSFNGSTDYVDATLTNAPTSTNNVTMTAWVRTNGVAAYDGILETRQGGGLRALLISGGAGNGITFSWDNAANEYNAVTGLPLVNGQWHFVAAVVTSGGVTVYLDTNTYTDANANAAQTMVGIWNIGRDPTGGTRYWDGEIDDVRIYNRALTSTEILRLANGNAPATGLGTYSLSDGLDVNGSLSIHSGTLDVNGNNITLAGNWLNTGGVLDDETRTVTLDGNNQTIDYSETFFNLTKTVTTTGTLTVGQGATIKVDGALTLSGAASNLLGIESSDAATRHIWDVTAGDQNASFVDVNNSETLSNDIIATFSNDTTNNDSGEGTPNWIFASTFYWINTLGGDTNDSSNWASAANACGVGGGAGIPGPTDVATFQANCDDNAAVDVNFNVAALDIQSGYTGTITPDSGVLIDVDGPFTQADGTVDLSANNTNMDVSGNFTKTGGTFTTGTGQLNLDGGLIISVNAGTNLGDVSISESPDVAVTLGSDVAVHDLTIGSGDTLTTDGYELTLTGTFDLNGALDATNGTDGDSSIYITGNWDMTGGTFINTRSTVSFNAGSGTVDIISEGESFYNFRLDDSGGSLTVELEDALDINGTVTIANGTLDVKSGENNALSVAGSWDNNDIFTARLGNVTFDGTATQTVSNNSGTFNDMTVTNTDATVTFNEAFTTTDFTSQDPGSTLRFQQSTTFTISGDLNITGTVGNLIDINSVDDTNPFDFNITGSGNETVNYLRVEHSRVTNGGGNDIVAINSLNAGSNDDGDAPPTDQWIFLIGNPEYMQPDTGVPGMNLVVQIIGANFRDDSSVTTSSSDIVVGTTVVTDDSGAVVTTGGRVITASFFVLPSATTETVTVTVDGVNVDQKFQIEASIPANECEFAANATIGDGTAGNGTRTKMGTILCDNLIVPVGVTINVDVTDSDGTTAGNQGYMPAIIIVEGTVDIDGEINVDGFAGAVNVGDVGGAGGNAGPGGGGGGAGAGQAAAQSDGGDGFTGGGGGSCDSNSPSCSTGTGGDGTGATGSTGVGAKAGDGGAALVVLTTGGIGGTGDTADGSGGSGGTGFAFGSSGSGASDPATNGTGGSGGGAAAFDGNAGGGGFGEAGVDGVAGTGGSVTGNTQLVPFMGGSGGGGGGAGVNGSGGGGGGGGTLIIMATGTITIDGIISADGGAGAAGTDGDGAGGSGGSIVLQAPEVQLAGAQWDTDGGAGTAAGGDGRIRVDGVPMNSAAIDGTISDANTTQFVGPAITEISATNVIGTAGSLANIEVHITNGVTSTTTTGSAAIDGDFSIPVTYLSGANYITVITGTMGGIEVMSSAALGVLTVEIGGNSDLTAGTTVRCAQNSGVLPQTTMVAGGVFNITGADKPDTNDVITCWADGVSSVDESTAVTKYDGIGNITGLELNRHKLTIGSDDNANVTVANLSQYDQDNDEDIMYTSNSNVFRVDPSNVEYADEEVVIHANNTLSVVAAETFTTHGLDIDGTLSLTGAATVNVSGTFDSTGAGMFTKGNSVITMNGTMDQMLMPDNESFYGLTINNTGAVGNNDVIILGTLNVDDDLTITDGDLDQGTNNAPIFVFDDWTVGVNGTLTTGTSTVTFDSTSGNQAVSSGDVPFYDVVINNTDSPPDNLIIVSGTMKINGDLDVNDGQIDLALNDANIEIAGDFIINTNGGLNGGTTGEIILFDGTSDQTLTTNAQTFPYITINNTGVDGVSDSVILTDALDINGTLNIMDGDLDVNTNDLNINIAGNWIIGASGTFDAGAGTETVTFDGDDQTIFGTTWFNNFVKAETTNDGTDTNLTFEGGMTQHFKNNLTLNGLDANDRLNLDSTTGTFFFDVLSDQSTSFLVVQNSEVDRNNITTTTSIDNGTDSAQPAPHWIFSQSRYWVGATNPANTNLMSSWATVSGVCGTGGASIPTLMNDVIFDGVCDNNATVDANFTIASMDIQTGYTGTITTNAGIIIDVEGNYTQVFGTLDLSTNGGELLVGGNFLKTGGVILNASGTITMDGVATLDADSGTNLGNVVISPPGAGTVRLESDLLADDLTILSADFLDVDGYELDITDDVIISGTIDLTSGADGVSTVTIGGGWDATGGIFTHSDAIITFTSTNSEIIVSNGNAFNDLTFNGGTNGIWILQDDMDLNEGMNLLGGTVDANVSGNYSINVSGNWVETAGTFLPRLGTVTFDQVSGIQTISADTSFYNFVIDDPDDGADLTIRPISGTLDINGTLLQQDSTFDLVTNNVGMAVGGNFTLNAGTFNPPVTTIVFDGVKTFTDNIMTNVGTILITPNTTQATDFSGTSLTIAVNDTWTTDGYEMDLSANIRVNGTLDARQGTDGFSTINIGRNWRSQAGLLIMGESTVVMDDASGSNIFRTGDSNTFYNVTFDDANGGGDTTWELRDNINIWGTLQILDGIVDDRNGVNEPIEVRGNWNSTGGTFIQRMGTVTFAGTGTQTITVDDDTFYNVNVTNSSGMAVTFVGSTTFNNFTSTIGSTSLVFGANETFEINGSLRLDGQLPSTRITLDSSDGTNRFEFDVTGSDQNVRYLDVSNSESTSNDILAANSLDTTNTDSGDLPATAQWIFIRQGPLKGAVIIVD